MPHRMYRHTVGDNKGFWKKIENCSIARMQVIAEQLQEKFPNSWSIEFATIDIVEKIERS